MEGTRDEELHKEQLGGIVFSAFSRGKRSNRGMIFVIVSGSVGGKSLVLVCPGDRHFFPGAYHMGRLPHQLWDSFVKRPEKRRNQTIKSRTIMVIERLSMALSTDSFPH